MCGGFHFLMAYSNIHRLSGLTAVLDVLGMCGRNAIVKLRQALTFNYISMDGLFLENGPYRVNKDLSLSVNPGGWQNYATNIYGSLLQRFSKIVNAKVDIDPS